MQAGKRKRERETSYDLILTSHFWNNSIFKFTFFFFFNVYLFLTEMEHEQGRGRERDTQNPKQAPGSELSAQSLTRGSNSWTARS